MVMGIGCAVPVRAEKEDVTGLKHFQPNMLCCNGIIPTASERLVVQHVPYQCRYELYLGDGQQVVPDVQELLGCKLR